MLTCAYNAHVHRSTNTTTFDLVLSRPPPPYAVYHSIRSTGRSGTTDGDTHKNFHHRLDVAISNAKVNLRKVQDRYKNDFDKHVHKRKLNIRVGDYVYIDPRGARVRGHSKRNKLQHSVLGPYEVLQYDDQGDDPNVTIQRGGEVERINVDRITYAPAPDEPGPASENRATPEDFAEKKLDGETWVIDDIPDHRKRNGKYEFLIKCMGSDQTTWNKRRHTPEELIAQYFARKKSTTRESSRGRRRRILERSRNVPLCVGGTGWVAFSLKELLRSYYLGDAMRSTNNNE